MSGPTERVIKTKVGWDHLVRLHPEKLPAPAEKTPQPRAERKFNVRVKQQDLLLLDELAKAADRPRSELINELLHTILLEELMSIEALDARMLLADKADSAASYSPLTQSWTIDVLAQDINRMVHNVMEHGDVDDEQNQHNQPWDDFHSDAFKGLRATLKGIKR